MTWLLVTAISIVEALIHYALHHKAQVAAALAGLAVWTARRSGLTRIPLLAPEPGTRGAHGKTRRALRQAAKARKQATV